MASKNPQGDLVPLDEEAFVGNADAIEKYGQRLEINRPIVDRIRASENKYDRNLVSLMVSRDAVHWHLALDLIDEIDKDPKTTGFQYPDFCFDEGDILCLVRTALLFCVTPRWPDVRAVAACYPVTRAVTDAPSDPRSAEASMAKVV